MFAFFLLFIYISETLSYGYDSGTDQGACGQPPYRTSRMLKPPCDLAIQTYCPTAGTTYPWHAVRRFIRENQGLMRRMYGDERHIAVLRAELESNEVNSLYPGDHLYDVDEFKNRYAKQDDEFDNELYDNDENTARFLQDSVKIDDILNTKFVYSGEPTKSVKLGDLRTVPHFRPTTQKTVDMNATVNKTVAENLTVVALYDGEEDQSVRENVTDRITTEESTTDTTVIVQETTTESNKIKETAGGAVLFQDTVENKDKIQPTMNYKTQGVNACPVKQEVVAPFWANNTRGEVLALLNLYPFEQYVHWEKCTYEHRQMYCRDGCRCEQQYRLHRLLAYDPNNECRGIFSDWFKFPSCCVCKCYDIPEFRVTSRSPRNKEDKYIPNWFKKKKDWLS